MFYQRKYLQKEHTTFVTDTPYILVAVGNFIPKNKNSVKNVQQQNPTK